MPWGVVGKIGAQIERMHNGEAGDQQQPNHIKPAFRRMGQ
jgi:hypothetical protein